MFSSHKQVLKKVRSSKTNWFGARPQDETEARKLLMAAALRCVQRFGLEKTSLNDIASEAGVTRPTVYRYFDNCESILYAAMEDAGQRFSIRALTHAKSFEDPADQIVEGFVYCLQELPKDPELVLLLDPEVYSRMSIRVFSTDDTMLLTSQLLEKLIKLNPGLENDADEMAEFATRLLLSMLTIRGPRKRTADEQRAFLRRRLLPGLTTM